MDPKSTSKSKNLRRGRLMKSRAVESSNESSPDEKSEEESQNLGSRIKLIRDKRKLTKSNSRKSLSRQQSSAKSDEQSENTIIEIKPTEVPPPIPVVEAPKESSFAQSIKRKFGFFRKSSEIVKSIENVEAAVANSADTPEIMSKQIVDVVVDVHTENETKKSRIPRKTKIVSKSSDDEIDRSSPENLESLDHIEEVKDEEVKDIGSPKTNVFNYESDSDAGSELEIQSLKDQEDDKKSIEELPSEILPTSGGESARRRKRWDKPEILADNLVEDFKKPKRKQWAKGVASAEIRNITGRKIVVPKRSATAEPVKLSRTKASRSAIPVAAPRSKSLQKEETHQGFDNDGFSSDHDEVLRIETVNDSSPKIKLGNKSNDEIEDGASTLSEAEEIEEQFQESRKHSMQEVKEYLTKNLESIENLDVQNRSPSDTNGSPEFVTRKVIPRRRSSTKRKSSSDKRSIDDDDDEEVEDDEDEQETVLNVMEKKSRRSSSSSKIEIIPTNFFEKNSSDETTISTNEEMHTSRKDSQRSKSSRSQSKSKSARRSDDASERSLRTKRKTTSSSTRNSAEEQQQLSSKKRTKSRTKKRHRKKEKLKKLEDVEEEMKYVSIRIHRSDMLEADYITRHPMVKVHIVSADTGEYLKIRNKDEQSSDTLLLQPIITGKFDFMEKKSMVPVWEEELIFEQNFKDLLVEGKRSVVILFEIVDLLSFSEASVSYDQFGKDSCWYKVAWAFLRPVGVSGVKHINKKVRLQLYWPKKTFRRPRKNKCEVYRWWKSGSREKYPSSLYITITAVDPPKLEPVFYEQLLELHDLSEMRSDSQDLLSPKPAEEITDRPKWTRLAAQSCQIPNETYLETEVGDNGCFHVAFSNDGKYLACALSEDHDYPILVYKVDDAKIHVRFFGHKNFIYSLSWSHDDRYLLTVSSDQTARLWDVNEKIIEHIQSLPHPSYVYCGKFSLDPTNYIITGCYDHVARVWARLRPNSSRNYELVQELEAHESFVNTICFQAKDETCMTGDGSGIVIIWTIKKSRRSPIRREWQIARKIKIKEIDGVPINSIVMHPLGSRVLIHSRNNGLRLIDLMTGVVVKKFEGLKNQRIQITACISPCGSLLFCGGEDSTLNVWSIDSGKLVATYEIDSHEKAVTCVDYHPYDHAVAFCTYGAPLPVKVLKFDREATCNNVGLKLLAMTTSMMSVNSTARLKEQHMIYRNGGRQLELSARSLNSSTNVSHMGPMSHLLMENKDEDEMRRNLKTKIQKFMESGGPNFKAKSMNRLNGIIEKIDKILMYATSQKSPAIDLESARNPSVFTVEEKYSQDPTEEVELVELSVRDKIPVKPERKKKQRARSRSARTNVCSPTHKETEFSKAFSDSAAFTHKVSRFSDDSSNSYRPAAREKFVIESLELNKIECVDTDTGFKDSLDTIIDGKEDFPSEENLDVESLNSDDTYVVKKEKKLSGGSNDENDKSENSNATFIIENEIPPVPKPRKRVSRIEVM